MIKKLKTFDWKHYDFRKLLKNKWFWFTGASIVTLILALVCMAGFRHAGNSLRSQHIVEEWAANSETEYAQISVFLPEGNTLDNTAIYTFRDKIITDVTDLLTEDVKNVYCDAWSAKGSVNIQGENGKADASVIAVGGDFFQLHPQNLLSGGYFSDDDLMHDRVILDEEMAWKLFGGYDLEGMSVTIAGQAFQVAGVIARETDSATAQAYSDGGGLYMSYDAYQSLNEDTYINCYEILMPNPVDGYAVQAVTDGLAQQGAVIVENNSRYTAGSIFKLIKNFSQRTMRTDTVSYPYWENAARLVENRCMIWLALAILFWICPVVFLVIVLVKSYRRTRKKMHATWLDLKDQYENRVLWTNLRGKLKGWKHGRTDTETR